MRFLVDKKAYLELQAKKEQTNDCYVRPGEYLHHMYVDGVKYGVALAVMDCLKEAQEKKDAEAYRHLLLHKKQLDALYARAQQQGLDLERTRLLGDPPPINEGGGSNGKTYVPPAPRSLEETGLNRSLIYELILRIVYNLGRPTGGDVARTMGLPYRVIEPVLMEMRQKDLLEMIGQRGVGEIAYEYIPKPGRGQRAVEDALKKTEYAGVAPVLFDVYLKAVQVQTLKNMVVTRRNINQAFQDLIIYEAELNEIGPAVNSADSIFMFGFPGNGKTSIAERITRLMGGDIFIPYALDIDGQIVKLFDPIVHTPIETAPASDTPSFTLDDAPPEAAYDQRWVRVKRPTVIVGGELVLPMLDLKYNDRGRFYEAPLQMKANNGIFMIDDFGRQQVRPMDLLNRWIVPLEKKYDYLTTITGNKIQVPFDVLLIFSTNLDPNQLADEAFLRRIKFKIEIRDPDEKQWRQIWDLTCRSRKLEVDPRGLDYLIEKWYKPYNRPLRKCHPRDILNQMISIAKYNMETVSFTPDLIDAACESYFVSQEQKNFGARVNLE